jgi:aryl-alcohol dehydrogenase-like predicted oxidoreductase
MGGAGWLASLGAQQDRDSRATIAAAIEAGVNWIDTAPYYGLGHAEEVIGDCLAALPVQDRPMVFTKCGIVWESAHEPPAEVLSPDSIRKECETSLRRLRVERLDLLQVHWPATDGTAIEDSWAALADLVDEGKVRWIGVSNFDNSLLDRCERIRHVDTLQPPFSLLRRDAAAELIPWCHRHATAVLVYSPLESGLLADAYTPKRVADLAPTDVRLERTSVFCEPAFTRNLSFVERLRALAAELGFTVPELASAWVLSWPGVTAAILGARTPAQLAAWSRSGSLRLDVETLASIAEALEATGAGSGPLLPPLEPTESERSMTCNTESSEDR